MKATLFYLCFLIKVILVYCENRTYCFVKALNGGNANKKCTLWGEFFRRRGALHFKFKIINIKVAPLSAEQNSRETWQRLGGWKYETNFSLKYETEKFYRCLCRIFHSRSLHILLRTEDQIRGIFTSWKICDVIFYWIDFIVYMNHVMLTVLWIWRCENNVSMVVNNVEKRRMCWWFRQEKQMKEIELKNAPGSSVTSKWLKCFSRVMSRVGLREKFGTK